MFNFSFRYGLKGKTVYVHQATDSLRELSTHIHYVCTYVDTYNTHTTYICQAILIEKGVCLHSQSYVAMALHRMPSELP
mgnify:CR=1 FL=1